jgi:dTDP-L-rhamnose 4-epimerase
MSAKYLITGGAGFIGRELCRELLENGRNVRILDSLIPQVHSDTVPELPPGAELIIGDVRHAELLDRALSGVDGVFHLAAEVGVGQSMYEIARYVNCNDVGTATLLECLSTHPISRLVVASSMSVYGEGLYQDEIGRRFESITRTTGSSAQGWDPVAPDGSRLVPIPTDETTPVNLASIYALTKFVQERSCQLYGTAYGVEVVTLRLFNVFGPGQALSNPYTGVLANFGARLLNGQRPLIFEDGQQKRDFVHVRDVVRACRMAMDNPLAAGHVFNVGSGQTYAVSGVAELLADAMERPDLQPQLLDRARAGDIRHCFADITKARDLLGYHPTRLLEDAVDELADWIRRSIARDGGEDARRQLEARGLVT